MGGGHHASDELDSSDDEDQQHYNNNQPGPSQVFMNNNGNNKNTKAAKFDQLLKVSFLQEAHMARELAVREKCDSRYISLLHGQNHHLDSNRCCLKYLEGRQWHRRNE